MFQIEIKGDPPNKQGNRDAPTLIKKLESIKEKELKSQLISENIKIQISLFYHPFRYIRAGYDNTYVGDLDNIISGICDILKKRIIIDDSQIIEIQAKRCTITDISLEEKYVINIEI